MFEITLVSEDRPLLEALQCWLGAGRVEDRGRRSRRWAPESRLTIASERDHLQATIPFATRYLAPCRKRDQFQTWTTQLLRYRQQRPTRFGLGPSTCSIAGCTAPVRGRTLCRRHYYAITGW